LAKKIWQKKMAKKNGKKKYLTNKEKSDKNIKFSRFNKFFKPFNL